MDMIAALLKGGVEEKLYINALQKTPHDHGQNCH